MTKKKHEELVEEIATILYDDVVSTPRVKVRKTITHILSAVRDGLELPGEAGRYSLLPPGERTYSEWALDMHIEEAANDFIALRKEEEK